MKIVKNGTPVENEFVVKQGDTTLTADDDKVDGFTTYTLKSNGTGSVEYKVIVEGVDQTLKITQITTDSTVFEVGAAGGYVPSDVATQSWVQTYVSAQTSEFVDGNDVDAAISAATSTFVTASVVDAAISAATSTFVSASDVDEAISAATSEFATTSAVEAAISTATTDMATQTWVGQQGYATTSAMSSAISAATSNKVTGGAIGLAPVVSSAVAVYETDWASLSATANPNTFYVVLPDPV